MSMIHHGLVAHLCLYFTLLFHAPLAAGSINTLTLHDGKLTVSASQISLVDLARELTNVSGINFVTVGETNKLIDVDISDEPFAKAIAKLSPNHLLVSKTFNVADGIYEVIFMLQDDYSADTILQEYLPTGEPVQDFIEPATQNVQEPATPVEVTKPDTDQSSVSAGSELNQ